jgi:hypothetical protein
MIKADKLKPVDVYKPGEDAVTSELSPNAVRVARSASSAGPTASTCT